MNKIFYVYYLMSDNNIFYVGKGSGDRFSMLKL